MNQLNYISSLGRKKKAKCAFFLKYFSSVTLLCSLLLSSCGEEKSVPIAYQNPVVMPFTMAIEEVPDDPVLYYQRAIVLQQIGADSLAIQDLEKACQLDSIADNYWEALGIAYLNNGQVANSISTFKRCLAIAPSNVNVKLLLSKAYLQDNNLKAAQQELDDILQVTPDYPDALYWQAQIYKVKKDTISAIQHIQQALKIEPEYYQAALELADLYAATHNNLAIAQYQKVFQLDTLDVFPLYKLAQFYQSNNLKFQSKEAFKNVILKDPSYADAYFQTGKILIEEDSIDKALRQFNLAILNQPNDAESYYFKGVCFEKLNQKDSAKVAFQQALIYDKNLKEAANKLKSYQ